MGIIFYGYTYLLFEFQTVNKYIVHMMLYLVPTQNECNLRSKAEDDHHIIMARDGSGLIRIAKIKNK